MARPLRIQFEDAYYHLTCRGYSRQDIYETDGDRLAFLDLLEKGYRGIEREILMDLLYRYGL